jgi:1,2-diacylglycerol 3-beta-galactosyltransferase
MKNIYILYADGGGGHRVLMETLRSLIRIEHPDSHIEGIDVWDPVWRDPNLFWIPKDLTAIYNKCPPFLLNLLLSLGIHGTAYLEKFLWKSLIKSLEKIWKEKKPDFVISVYPCFNYLIHQSLVPTETPFLTMITDYGESHPCLWIHSPDHYYICSEEGLYQKILSIGTDPQKVLNTSGYLMPSPFYKPHSEKKEEYRKLLDLDPDVFTIVTVFGAYGSSEEKNIFRSLSKIEKKLQLIFITGKERPIPPLLQKPSHHKVITIPFSHELEKILAAADLFIGKASAGVISQAIAQKIPVIVKDNITTMYQERFNVAWVKKHGFGLPISNWNNTHKIVQELIDSKKYDTMKANLMQYENLSDQEISSFLNNIIQNISKL